MNIKDVLARVGGLLFTIAIIAGVGWLLVQGNNDGSKPSAGASGTATNTPTPKSTSLSRYDDPAQFSIDDVANVINGYRITTGIVSLQKLPELDGAANLHAYDMQKNNYLSAISPDGTTDLTRTSNAVRGLTYEAAWMDTVCNNVTISQITSSIIGGIENEKTLVDPKFDYYGVGYVASTGKGTDCNGKIVIYYVSVH